MDNDRTVEFDIDDAGGAAPRSGVMQKLETERKRLELELEDIKDRYRTLFQSDLYGVLSMDVYGQITHVNAAQSKILGYREHELKSREIWGLLLADADRRDLTAFLTQLVKSGPSPASWTGRFVKKNGKPVELTLDWSLQRNASGTVTGFISVTADVKEQADASAEETADAGTTKALRRVLAAARDLILTFGPDGAVTYVNPNGAETLGYYEEELLEMNAADILPPDQLARIREALMAEGRLVADASGLLNARFISRDLKIIPMEVHAAVTPEAGGARDILIIARDLTERTRTAEEAVADRNAESLADFAGDLADDVNDLLTGVMAAVDLAQMNLDSPVAAARRLTDAKEGVNELKALVQKLAVISGAGVIPDPPGALDGLIREAAGAAAGEHETACDVFLPEDLRPAAVHPALFKQALEAVIANACEATPAGGRVEIRAENVASGAGDFWVKITVRDAGPGIPENYLSRIFDPYFSAKTSAAGKGKGLGLTMARAVMNKHGGRIRIASASGAGAVARICLPAATEHPKPAAARQRDGVKGGVLIMEADAVVCDVARQTFAELGYAVEFAAEGAEAVRKYQSAMTDGRPFVAAMLDLTVKNGMGAVKTLKKLHNIDPGVTAVVTSDYANDPEMSDCEKYGFVAALEKPYSIDDVRTVFSLIAATQEEAS